MSANIVMLLALIVMIGIFVWLFRDGEGTLRTGRIGGKLRDAVPGAHIRIKADESADATAEQPAETGPDTKSQG